MSSLFVNAVDVNNKNFETKLFFRLENSSHSDNSKNIIEKYFTFGSCQRWNSDLLLIANKCKFGRKVICLVYYNSVHFCINLEVLRSNAKPYKKLLVYTWERCQKCLQKSAAACGNVKQFKMQSGIPAYSYPSQYHSPSQTAIFLLICDLKDLNITWNLLKWITNAE